MKPTRGPQRRTTIIELAHQLKQSLQREAQPYPLKDYVKSLMISHDAGMPGPWEEFCEKIEQYTNAVRVYQSFITESDILLHLASTIKKINKRLSQERGSKIDLIGTYLSGPPYTLLQYIDRLDKLSFKEPKL
jgi:hypothetical protein